MSLRSSARSASAAHWSKAFVEHLRTVHFALIGVAIGLILIVVSAKPYNAAVALRQIHQIIELKKMWSLKWILWKGQKKEATESDESDDSKKDNKPISLANIGDPAHWQHDPLLPPESEGYYLESRGDFPIFQNAAFEAEVTPVDSKQSFKSTFLIERYWAQEHTEPDWSPEVFPSTLYDFRQWWTVLQKDGYKAVFPRSLDESSGRCFTVASTAYVSSLVGTAGGAGSIGLSLNTREKSLVYEGTGPGMCFFPVHRFVYVKVSQQMVADQFKNWKVGSFDTSFPDLARAGHDLEALELDDVEKFISSEAAKGTEVFEAFGMKFPAGQITLWGIVVLLGVQLYFFVYLKQLSGKLAQTDAGWDVPWIGMDTSPLAQSIFFLTVVLLPCLAMALLGTHAVSQLDRPIVWRSWPTAEALGVAVAFIPTAVLGLLSWRYRPNLHESGTPPDVDKTPATGEPPAASPTQPA